MPHVVLPAPSRSSAHNPKPAPPPLASLGILQGGGQPPPILDSHFSPRRERRHLRGWGIRSWVCDSPQGARSYPGWGWDLHGTAQWAPAPPRPCLKDLNGRALEAQRSILCAATAPPCGEGRKCAASPAMSASLEGGHPCGKPPHPSLPLSPSAMHFNQVVQRALARRPQPAERGLRVLPNPGAA